MYNFVRKMILLSILFSVTQIFEISKLGISLYQLVLFLTGAIAIVGLIKKREIYKGMYIFLALINVIGAMTAYVTSLNPSWAKSYLLVSIMMSMYIFVIPNFFQKEDIHLLEKTLIRSQYLTILLSLYSIFLFYFAGGMPEKINILNVFTVSLEEDAIARMQISGHVRLMLPYATPSVLSVVMGCCILMLLYNKELYKPFFRFSLVCAFTVILVLTGSRTGIVGIVIVILLRTMAVMLMDRRNVGKIMILVGLIVVVFIGILSFAINFTYINRLLLNRLLNINLFTDRHFLIPIEGLLIQTDSIKNFFIGIGFGSSLYMQGRYTELPPYFLNSFVTLPVERGIFGLVMDALLLIVGVIDKLKRLNVKDPDTSVVVAFRLFIVSSLFYELLNCYFIVILLAICLILERKGEDNEKCVSNNSDLQCYEISI